MGKPDTLAQGGHEVAVELVGAEAHLKEISAFLNALVPAWLPSRSHVIAPAEFTATPALPFPLYDLFGDGLIRLVFLPGHAPGHLGVLLPFADRPLLYATDAYWNWAQVGGGIDLIPPVRRLQWDGRAYEQTVQQLREVQRAGQYQILACHAPETQGLIGTGILPA